MAENTTIPTLTLDPNGAQAAAQAATLEEEIQQAAEEVKEPAVEFLIFLILGRIKAGKNLLLKKDLTQIGRFYRLSLLKNKR